MTINRIGFASQLRNGVWGPVFANTEQAERWARERQGEVDPSRTALEILADLPDGPPRPVVVLASGERVRYNPARTVYIVSRSGTTPVQFPRLVELVRQYDVQDTELDALQALPAQTAAWVAAGGRD